MMNRRHFVKNSSQASLALALLGLAACKDNTSKKPGEIQDALKKNKDLPFKLSLAQWSVHNMIANGNLDPLDFASKANAWGFSGLEYVNHLYNKHLEGYSDELTGISALVKELNQRSGDHNMENLIMMVDLQGDTGALSHPDKNIRNAAIESHHKWIDATAGLGCHSMRVNLFGTRDRDTWKNTSAESLTSLCEYAKKQEVNVIVENHGWLSSDAALLAEVITAVNMDNCGTLPDFGNFCVEKDGQGRWDGNCIKEYDRYQGTKELLPYAKGVSAKSYDFDEAGKETTIDYEKMLKIVLDSGYDGYIGVEYEGSRLSEEEGILATRNLLINAANTL